MLPQATNRDIPEKVPASIRFGSMSPLQTFIPQPLLPNGEKQDCLVGSGALTIGEDNTLPLPQID